MAPNSAEVTWGPGFIGYSIATALYGIFFGQYVFYLRSFPQDSKRLKLSVMTVFLFDTINQFSMMAVYWSILISCRRSMSLQCTTKISLYRQVHLSYGSVLCNGHWRRSWQYLRHIRSLFSSGVSMRPGCG
ncbi:hypothetical protein BDR07DRAFT_140220 [Suillus spraguei]|nr:hypothetical protein BDR07DRAFT_140220 [Suillus spraguei]